MEIPELERAHLLGRDRRSGEICSSAILERGGAQALEQIFRASPSFMALTTGPEHVFEQANERYYEVIGVDASILGRRVRDALPEAEAQGYIGLLDEVRRTGKPHQGYESLLRMKAADGADREIYVDLVYQPIVDTDGRVSGIIHQGYDVTDKVLSRSSIEVSRSAIANERENFRNLFRQTPEMVCILRGPEHVFEFVNEAHIRALGFDATGMAVRAAQPESVEVHGILDEVYRTGRTAELFELPVTLTDRLRYFNLTYAARRNEQGQINGIMILGVEVTDQVLARERLREGEARLKFAMTNANMGTWRVKMSDGKVELSEESHQIFGLVEPARDVDQTIGMVIHPDDRQRAKAELARAIADKKIYQSEYRIVRPRDGRERWIFAAGRAQYSERGDAEILSGVILDITARREAEETLREKEEQYRSIFESTNDAIFILDSDGRVIEANPAGCTMHGYTYEEILGRTGEDLVHADDLHLFRKLVEEVSSGRRFTVFVRHLRKDGTEIDVHVAGTTGFIFKRKPALMAVVRDITEHKKAQEELRAREAEFRALANSVAQLAWMADAHGQVYWYNRRWYEYTGTDFSKMQSLGWQAFVHPEYVGRVQESIAAAWRTPETWELTFPLKSGNGQWSWFLTRAVPIRDAEGHIERWVGTNTDITEQKKTQEVLQHALKARDEFLSIASHELKTPITSLRMQLQMTQRSFNPQEGKSPSPERLSRMLDTSTRQVDRLTRLVEDLLDVTRIKAGKLELRFEWVDLAQLISEAVDRYTDAFKLAGSTVEVVVVESVWCECDRFRIDQVVVNLLSNAIKYGEGRPIRVSVRAAEECAYLAVEDQGIGIAREKQGQVFGRFERAISAENISGLGLGLFIVKQIIDAHGGSIELESELNRGTVFTVQLPIKHSSIERQA